jgi:hypothetical protein
VPRLIPKHARQTTSTAARPLMPTALRVTRDFTCEGTRFKAGMLVSADAPLVRRILAEHPTGYFESATT